MNDKKAGEAALLCIRALCDREVAFIPRPQAVGCIADLLEN